MLKKLFFILMICFMFITNTAFTIVGHRGDPIKAPEETFQSFDTAFAEGAQYVELDVHMSADNVLVVSHDRDLSRITGHSLIVSQNNFSSLATLPVTNGETIHSLDQVFVHYQNNPNAKFLIETKKTAKGTPQNMEEVLAQVVAKYHMENRVAFHSFSAKSIANLKHYFPKAPRIFISGSLKRINFSVLKNSTGVNISSKLVTPKLVDQLHKMEQQVYVWDEMNENPDKWNWLINIPIDGIVTNYPETAVKYNRLKSDASTKSVNKSMIYLNDQQAPIYENPYTKNKITGYVQDLQEYKVNQIVTINKKTYYQLGNNKFSSSDSFSDINDYSKLMPYLHSTISSITDTKHSLYSSPKLTTPTNETIINNLSYQVEGIEKDGSNVWLKVNHGWLLANGLLIHLQNNNRLRQYLNLPSEYRLTNIDIASRLEKNATNNSYLPNFDFNSIISISNQNQEI